MSEIKSAIGDDKFFGAEIRKNGVIDMKRLYRSLVPWFHNYKYNFMEKGKTSRTRSDGKEQRIEWAAYRKVDSYFKFHIAAEIIVYRWLNEKAEVTVRFKGYLEKDYRNRFKKKGKFGAVLRKIYEDYIIKDKEDSMKNKVEAETNEFIDEVKKNLQLVIRR